MRRFALVRSNDIHGISGEGLVVWGICWPDGSCSYRWNSPLATWSTAPDIGTLVGVHVDGHQGGTRLAWLDGEEAMEPAYLERLAGAGERRGGPAG